MARQKAARVRANTKRPISGARARARDAAKEQRGKKSSRPRLEARARSHYLLLTVVAAAAVIRADRLHAFTCDYPGMKQPLQREFRRSASSFESSSSGGAASLQRERAPTFKRLAARCEQNRKIFAPDSPDDTRVSRLLRPRRCGGVSLPYFRLIAEYDGGGGGGG